MADRPLSYEQTAHRRAFGEQVASLRRVKGWTQEQLAERAEVHRSYLASVEGGGRNPTLDVIVRLASALQVPATRLLESPALDEVARTADQ